MIDLLVFIPACFALNMAFGPNNLLALTHGAKFGPSFAYFASFGRILIFTPMIAISGLGLGMVVQSSMILFSIIKILGAAYLIWIGIKLLRSVDPAFKTTSVERAPRIRSAFRNEALVAAGNPKAILIFAAFFPQFVDLQNYAASYLLLGGLFLVLEMLAIMVYASVGHYAASLAHSKLHWFQKASGVGMILFGILLLLTHKTATL